MVITKFKKKPITTHVCMGCLYSQIEKKRILMNPFLNIKGWGIYYFCTKKDKYIKRRLKMCKQKQTTTLETYQK